MSGSFYGIDLIDMTRKDNKLLFKDDNIKEVRLITIFEFIKIDKVDLSEFDVAYVMTADYKNVEEKLIKVLKAIQKKQLDYFCFDSNMCRVQDGFSWKKFMNLFILAKTLVKKGYAKSIGICNCNKKILGFLDKKQLGKPVICIQDIHFKNQQLDFIKMCNARGIISVSFTMLDGCMNHIRILSYLSDKYRVEVNGICKAWLDKNEIKYLIQNPLVLHQMKIKKKELKMKEKKMPNDLNLDNEKKIDKNKTVNKERKLAQSIDFNEIEECDWRYLENLDDDFFRTIFPETSIG